MFSRYFTDSHSIKTLPSYLLSSFIFISVIFLLFHISGFERVFEWNKSLRDAATGFAVFSLITYALREKLYSPLMVFIPVSLSNAACNLRLCTHSCQYVLDD